jgi:hypothetical protein
MEVETTRLKGTPQSNANNISVDFGHRVARATRRTTNGGTDQLALGFRYSAEFESLAATGACERLTRDAMRVAAEGRQKSVHWRRDFPSAARRRRQPLSASKV